MYSSYQNYLSGLSIETSNFKSNQHYNSILEHVSQGQGTDYLHLIENEFPEISFENIFDFVTLNDKYGTPHKYQMYSLIGRELVCSPTSLRYIYHSLLILKKFNGKSIVEIGCGYGGLFLSINFFSKVLNIVIEKYYLVDLPEVCELIDKYLFIHNETINIEYYIHDAYSYGADIIDNDLFLVSNYCFTEILDKHKEKYIELLFPKINSGFIIWQTIVFNLSVENLNKLNKPNINYVEERPQTSQEERKNYFVYF